MHQPFRLPSAARATARSSRGLGRLAPDRPLETAGPLPIDSQPFREGLSMALAAHGIDRVAVSAAGWNTYRPRPAAIASKILLMLRGGIDPH
jgi:hypothetical protein